MNYQKSKHDRGSSLITIIVACAVTAILSAALVTTILTSMSVSNQNNYSNQAYFTARSAVSAAISKLNDKNDSSFYDYISSLNDGVDYNSASGTANGLGSFTLTLRKTGDVLKITGKGYYPSGSKAAVKTVYAELSKSAGQIINDPNPLSNILYVESPVNSTINPARIFGNIAFNGPLSLSNGTSIDGNVYVGGSLTVSNGSTVTKNAYIAGNLSMAGNYIGGDAYCMGNVQFRGQNHQIFGKLFYKGEVTTLNNDVDFFAPSSEKKTDMDLKLALTPGTADTSLPSAAVAAVRSNLINITHSTEYVNTSGTVVGCENYSSRNTPVIIDTTGSDIYFLIDRTISLQNRQFYVTGPNHFYIYLEGGGTTLTLSGGNPIIRMQDISQESKIFVIGGAGTNLDLQSAEIMGSIYMPEGNVSVSGGVGDNGTQTGYAVAGNIAAKTVDIGSNVRLKYVSPHLEGTPLAVLIKSGGNQSGEDGGSWQVLHWGE
ncbi:MAG TPA: hypothetical protein VHO66_02500 [Ruminiclostridium sp.]|nr:hypothetical protein [Ruminiclostridium sp.]